MFTTDSNERERRGEKRQLVKIQTDQWIALGTEKKREREGEQ